MLINNINTLFRSTCFISYVKKNIDWNWLKKKDISLIKDPIWFWMIQQKESIIYDLLPKTLKKNKYGPTSINVQYREI